MSNLPGKKRPYQDQLRYKHMVARLQGQPGYKLNAILQQELARGKRWRIDATLEAINSGDWTTTWQYINKDDAFRSIGRYGRLTAFNRMIDILQVKPYERVTGRRETPASHDSMYRCFDEAVIHGHYRIAEAAWRYGATADAVLDSKYEFPRAMSIAVQEKDLTKIDYLLSRGADASYHLAKAIYTGNTALVAHFLDAGADPNYIYDMFRNNLALAVRCERDDIFDLLVARGADVTKCADEIYAPLLTRHTANNAEAIEANTQAIRRLRAAGVPVSENVLTYAKNRGKLAGFEDAVDKKPSLQPKPPHKS